MRALGLLGPLLLLVACGGSNDAAPPPIAPVPTAPPVAPPVASAPSGPAAPRTDASLIPRNTFFGNPERIGANISPDGKWIAFIAPVDGVLNVMVAPSDDVKKALPATDDKARPVAQFAWTKKK